MCQQYYCRDCGNYFDEDEIETRKECVSEFWGAPAYQEYEACPCCGSDDFIEVEDEEQEADDETDSDNM